MVTSLLIPGTPSLQLPGLLQRPNPPFQLSGMPGFREGGPSGPPPCDSVKFPTPLKTPPPALGRSPFWSDRSLQSLDRSRSPSDFLVAAKGVATNRKTQTSRASDARFMTCLSSSRGGKLGDRRALRVAHLVRVLKAVRAKWLQL